MKKEKFVCPMHTEVSSQNSGKCSICGMKLVLENSVTAEDLHFVDDGNRNSYIPLFVIIGLIFLVSFVISFQDFYLTSFISHFMIGFFLVFGGFKLLDLDGFAEGYSTYDLLAQKWYGYGYFYPFIELFFGIAMILNIMPRELLLAEVVVMGFSGLGIAIKLLKRERFQCACLGTLLKVPLTKVTLIEDFGMAFLALALLFLI